MIVAACLLLPLLSGCAANQTEYRVSDRFVISDSTDPKHRYFLELELPRNKWEQKGTKVIKYKDVWVSRDVWADCYLEDTYVEKRIGRDKCVRTPQSRMDRPPIDYPTP